MKKTYINPSFPHMLHGGDYNPDQWRDCPEILAEDMRLQRLAGCNTMSVGIFAWAALEPEEGKFDFSFLDKALDDIYANGGRVFLATPTGARPAWLSHKYPEVLRTNRDDSVNSHGDRHNHCYTSPIYREKMSIINRRLAERYKDHPAVLGWHLSNEYGGYCYCEKCRAAFRLWLKEKYGTLEALNKQWWTAFWAHTYTAWEQIDPPLVHGETCTHGLVVDWKRFCTHQTVDFMKAEIRALREAGNTLPVTSNLMGIFTPIDYREFAKELDFISVDLYPAWKGTEEDITTASLFACQYDLTRSLQHKSFVLMESAPGLVNWHPYNKLKRPGMHAMAGLQAVAHGSDSVMYFQWRKSRGSSEKFHGAVVDHLGTEHTRVFGEVAALGARLKKLDDLVGSATESRVALLFDWDNHWALEDCQGFQKDNKKITPTLYRFYHALWKAGINTDIVSREDELSGYDVLIAPQLYMVPAALEEKLAAYVKNGGTLLCTYMTGMVNENDLCHLGGFPAGTLKEVFGIWNEEIDTLYPGEKNTVEYGGQSYDAVDYCELIHARGAKVLGSYTSDFYEGRPAVTVNDYGKGKAYYLAFRDTGDLTDRLVGELLAEKGIVSDFDGVLPYGVSSHSRTDGETLFVFLENYTGKEARLSTKQLWQNAESETPVTGEITLSPYEVLILKRNRA